MEKEKINVAEILRNCQSGMNLDCVCFENVVFDRVDDKNRIRCFVGSQRDEVSFNEYGCLNGSPSAKCVIFPKGETSWKGIQLPFKNGDILVDKYGKPFILKAYLPKINNVWTYCGIDMADNFQKSSNNWTFAKSVRFATEEEKQKLFAAIKANGYRWNAETKTLEKLIVPKFKVGDVIMDKDSYTVTITEVNPDDECYGYESLFAKGIGSISFSEESNWKLFSDKFDITTLKPFESRVLVRHTKTDIWRPAIWGCYDGELYSYVLGGTCWKQCIPYEGNEHLMGKKDDCDEYFKTWSE